ncbi:hypothetical protein K435DRAFT_561883, partial [Dendrothele bispora CBS 962.96]
PFVHKISIVGWEGRLVPVDGLFDDGAMVSAMSTSKYNELKNDLHRLLPSRCTLRMANGAEVPSVGCWKGGFEIDGVKAVGEFEVFEGGTSWDFLVGKPLLQAFKAIHRYDNDTVEVTDGVMKRCLHN